MRVWFCQGAFDLEPHLKKRSCSWGSVDLWAEGGAVDNGVIVTHGKRPVSPPGELSIYPWTVRFWLLPRPLLSIIKLDLNFRQEHSRYDYASPALR